MKPKFKKKDIATSKNTDRQGRIGEIGEEKVERVVVQIHI